MKSLPLSSLDNGRGVCETQRFTKRDKQDFQTVHGVWRDSMTALFKILWRMKTPSDPFASVFSLVKQAEKPPQVITKWS